jgi:hypothetical protein
MNGESKFFSLVSAQGGHEIRQKNHRVFRFPNGVQVVVAKTPSDYRSWDNAHAKLRRELGLTPDGPRVGKQRARQVRHIHSGDLNPARVTDSLGRSCSFEELMKAQGVKPPKWR